MRAVPVAKGETLTKRDFRSFGRSVIRARILLPSYCGGTAASRSHFMSCKSFEPTINSTRCHELRNYRYIAFNVKNVRGKKYLCMLIKASVLHGKTCVRGAATVQPHRDVIGSRSYLCIGCLVLDYLQHGLKYDIN